MAIDLENLNVNQRAAVEWPGGPLLVLAGPGSGKTRVLTTRIAKLIQDSPDQRFRILGLTFTTTAAAEMRDRVDAMVPEANDRALLSTFHSFCANILRQHGSHLGLTPDFLILNQQEDRKAVLKEAIRYVRSNGLDAKESDIRILPFIDRFMDNCISATEVNQYFQDKDFGHKVAVIYKTYNQMLISNNRLDFPSLLNYVVELLNEKPQIAKHIRTVYTHVCVDEFQDTNLAQYKVLQAILGKKPKNLFVVADDDQIIYQWNGAEPKRLQQMIKDYEMQVIQLPENYRCPPRVIELANMLIRYNLDRSHAKEPLIPVKGQTDEDMIRLRSFSSFHEELEWIAKDIATKNPQEKGQCVVLARSRKLLEDAVKMLQQHAIPASLNIRKDGFTSAPFRWLNAILHLANARADQEYLRQVCKAFYELDDVDLDVHEIVTNASILGGDNLRSWFDVVLSRNIEPHTYQFLSEAKKQLVDCMDFLNFITGAFKWFEILNDRMVEPCQQEGFVDYEEDKSIWQSIQQNVLKNYGKKELSLNILLQEYDLSPKSPPIPPDVVRCLTIHGSKGMEFQHVYLIGLAEDILPSFQSIKRGDKSREMQEERRNCFVAITRTILSLTMTYSNEYFGWKKQPSRFLREMGLTAF